MIKRIDKFMEKIEETILIYGTICMTLLLIINVLLRTFFNSSLTSAEEISQILLIAVTFVGLSHAARFGKHIRISTLHEYSNQKTRRVLASMVSLVSGLTLFWLSYIAFEYVMRLKKQSRLTPVLHIPVYLTTCIVVYGLFSSAVQYIHIFYLNIKNKDCYIGKTPEIDEIEKLKEEISGIN